MNYTLSTGKIVRIPDSEINKFVANHGITKDEAVQMWLEDEGYLENEEQEALCQKAKENRITATIHEASAKDPRKKTQRERVKKEDPTKEMIIAEIAKLLPNFAENVKVENAGKLITFTIGADNFKLDLIRQRAKK